MAVVTPSVNNKIGNEDRSIALYTWVLTTADFNGLAVELPEWADRTWMAGVTGDAFGGATVEIQGSNNNVDFYGLSNAAGGTALTFTAGGVKTVIENPLFMRPRLSVVGAGATITVSVLVRRPMGLRQ